MKTEFSKLIATHLRKVTLLSFCIVFLTACSSTPKKTVQGTRSAQELWIQQVMDYQPRFYADSNFTLDSVFELTPELKLEVLSRFATTPREHVGKEISKWLLSKDGLNMKYDVNANFTPIEAYRNRRGNCLSFTMLLATLANELGVDIKYNSVKIPQTWGLNESVGMIFFRHVNGVQYIERRRRNIVFDLAIEEYSPGYPQRIITAKEASALLHNNMAVDLLANKKINEAEHFFKTAISINPKNPDFWVNFGVLKKRQKQLDKAEYAFKKAYRLNFGNIPAVSNLERLYREQQDYESAKKFARAAERARNLNPYFHYNNALEQYHNGRYFSALKSTNSALRLHSSDPRFYELKNLISQKQGHYIDAEQALVQAKELASNQNQLKKYNEKLESLRTLNL